MKIERTTDNELADMAANIVELLSGTALASLGLEIRTALIAAIGTGPADLATQTAEAATLEAEKKAAFSTKNVTRTGVVGWSRQVRDSLKAARAPKSEFDLCGFDYPAPRINAYMAQDPSNLAGVGFSNGVNRLEFFGNNSPGQVFFDIWRRDGGDGAWHHHALTKKQTFDDAGVTPGEYYEYRVRAVAAQTTSNFSNTTIVYGVL